MANVITMLGTSGTPRQEKYEDYIRVSLIGENVEEGSIGLLVIPGAKENMKDVMCVLQHELEDMIDELEYRYEGVVIDYSFCIWKRKGIAKHQYAYHYGDIIELQNVDNSHEIMVQLVNSICRQCYSMLIRTNIAMDFEEVGQVMLKCQDTERFFKKLTEDLPLVNMGIPNITQREITCNIMPNPNRIEGWSYDVDMKVDVEDLIDTNTGVELYLDLARGKVDVEPSNYDFIVDFDRNNATPQDKSVFTNMAWGLQFCSLLYSSMNAHIG